MQQVNALPNQTPASTSNALALNDIHVPEQISSFPMAYGWWILAALIMIIIVFAVIKIRTAAKRNQVKKQALVQLKNNTEMNNSDIIILLKWAAMHYFSRVELAKLFGHSLQQFLVSKLPSKYQQSFNDLSEQAFLNQYHANSNAESDESFHQAATLWLSHALPPRPLKKEQKAAKTIFNEEQNTNQGASA